MMIAQVNAPTQVHGDAGERLAVAPARVVWGEGMKKRDVVGGEGYCTSLGRSPRVTWSVASSLSRWTVSVTSSPGLWT